MDDYPTEPLTATVEHLAELIPRALRVQSYSTPRIFGKGTKYLPENIYKSKDAQNTCNSLLKLNATLALLNLKELSLVSDIESFKITFREFNYSSFTDEMITFVGNFEKCTSFYSSYLDTVESIRALLMSTATRNISFGDTFIFEKESKVISWCMIHGVPILCLCLT